MSSAKPLREWVGGRWALPARIESMGDRCAEISLWVELPDLQVVGQVLEDPKDPQASFGQSLMRAMTSPLVGEPRRPQRVRVADAALAEQLEGFSFLDVEVAPTPEFDKVVRALGAGFGEASYFSDPALTPSDIEKLFVGARQLWAARPWTLVDDDALVHVEVPGLGIRDGCLSIVGSREEVRGFAFFPSYEDYAFMTGSAAHDGRPIGPLAAHRALYFSFDARDDVPEGMRNEVAEHDWPLADRDAYPMLLRMVDGKHAPVFDSEFKLATAILRALGTFVLRHPQGFENYGDVERRESHLEPDGLEVILSVPHPRALGEGGSWQPPPRAQTLDDHANPYGLPLEHSKLANLASTLGTFTLHRVLGLFCAVASIPQMPPPEVWVGEIMQRVKLASADQARRLLDPLMTIYSHVVDTLDTGDIDGLIPEAADIEACREWARGYTTLLGRLDPADLDNDEHDSAFAIQTLAEIPQMLELLDDLRGEDSREVMLAGYRESLADDADLLREMWSEKRAHPPSAPPETTFRREGIKVGRNDPCPCGSAKKYKKCCALV